MRKKRVLSKASSQSCYWSTVTLVQEKSHTADRLSVCVCSSLSNSLHRPTFECLRHLRSNLVTLSSWQMWHLGRAVGSKEPVLFPRCWCLMYSSSSRSLWKNNVCTETIQCTLFSKAGTLCRCINWEDLSVCLSLRKIAEKRGENHRRETVSALKDLLSVMPCRSSMIAR